jgi:hypothetical protein
MLHPGYVPAQKRFCLNSRTFIVLTSESSRCLMKLVFALVMLLIALVFIYLLLLLLAMLVSFCDRAIRNKSMALVDFV